MPDPVSGSGHCALYPVQGWLRRKLRAMAGVTVLTRKKTISTDAVLDAAEAVVADVGAHRLTLALVAEKAGISKGGLAYSFESKEVLIRAMATREMARFASETGRIAATMPHEPHARMLARIAVTRSEDKVMIARAASMAASLLQTDGEQALLRNIYRDDLDAIGHDTPEARRARVAFWAVEGMFLLRGLGFLDISDSEWEDSLDDIRDVCFDSLREGDASGGAAE